MKKIIFGLMMIMGVVMFTSCDPNAGTDDYIYDTTIVTPTDPTDPDDGNDEEVVSNENLSFEIDYGNNGYVKFLGAILSNGTLVYKGKSYKVYNVSTSKCKIVVDGLETEVMYSMNNTGVTMYIKNVESVTYTVTTVGTTTTTVFAVTTK